MWGLFSHVRFCKGQSGRMRDCKRVRGKQSAPIRNAQACLCNPVYDMRTREAILMRVYVLARVKIC